MNGTQTQYLGLLIRKTALLVSMIMLAVCAIIVDVLNGDGVWFVMLFVVQLVLLSLLSGLNGPGYNRRFWEYLYGDFGPYLDEVTPKSWGESE